MLLHYRIAFLGFSEFERGALASCLRLAVDRNPRYELAPMLTDADFIVADADHAASVQLVLATERLAETVFIGSRAPPGALVWMARPIDPQHVMREIDAMVTLAAAPPDPSGPRTAPLLAPLHLRHGAAAAAADAAWTDDAIDLRLVDPAPVRGTAPGVVAAAVPSTRAAAGAPHAAVQPAGAAPRPRALLVDDSDVALRFLELRLQPFGLQTDRAATSARAIQLLARHCYELVFLDIELGAASELDGLALCQHIKQSPGAVTAAVILLSAHHSELDRVRGALAGCDAYLGKPLDQRELERLLSRHGLTNGESAARRRRQPAAPG